MSAHIFDGKSFAQAREHELRLRVGELGKNNTTPKLVAFLGNNNKAGELYLKLKQEAAERIGAQVEIYRISRGKDLRYVTNMINLLNSDRQVHGVMIQLPLPELLARDVRSIFDTIAPIKDVDGHRAGSPYKKATVRAVSHILRFADESGHVKLDPRVVVVGSMGTVGAAVATELRESGFEVTGVDRVLPQQKKFVEPVVGLSNYADIVITATGIAGLISANHIKKGAVVIDIGQPKGDVLVDDDFVERAGFVTPVPGGVGPVTVVSLLENLITACGRQTAAI